MKAEVVYCWNCKTAMTLEGNYYKCPKCGATWNELPTLGGFVDIARDYKGALKTAGYHPVRRTASAAKEHLRRMRR